MTGLLKAAGDPSIVGFDAGWKVEMRRARTDGLPSDDDVMTFSRGNYFATVRVHRPATFRAATFEVVIDGLSDADHDKIVGGPYEFVKIRVGWRDLGSGAGAPFADIGAMLTGNQGDDGNYTEVIDGRLTNYERLHGEFRYRTRLAGVDRQFHRLRAKLATQPDVEAGAPATTYVKQLCVDQAGVHLVKHPPTEPYEAIDERIEIPAGSTIAQALDLVAVVAHGGGRGARIPMYVGVDGLHFGPWAASSEDAAATPKRLEPATGLVESKPAMESLATAPPAADPLAAGAKPTPFATEQAMRYDVTLRGRGDLTIGDRVELVIDEPEPGSLPRTTASSVLGGLGDAVSGVVAAFGQSPELNYETCHVVDVTHVIDRATGFVTTVRIERRRPSDDEPTEPTARSSERTSDEATRTAELIGAAASELAEVASHDVALVRAQSGQFQDVGGHAFQPQHVELDAGLQRERQSNAAVNAQPATSPTRLFNKSYVTLFAFGRTGLVIPHYPGTRVVTTNYRDEPRHALVAGCVWTAISVPDSQVGDYWLSLPIDVLTAERTDDPASVDPEAQATETVHDLTDGHGGRAIHSRGLRISVGGNHLLSTGERPNNANDDEILIEHTSGSSIRIDPDGNIEISTGQNITFTANKITMKVNDKVEVVQ